MERHSGGTNGKGVFSVVTKNPVIFFVQVLDQSNYVVENVCLICHLTRGNCPKSCGKSKISGIQICISVLVDIAQIMFSTISKCSRYPGF